MSGPNQRIENNFKYHAPTPEQQEKYVRLRGEAKMLAYTIDGECPDGLEKVFAMKKLEEAIFWANASIARSGA